MLVTSFGSYFKEFDIIFSLLPSKTSSVLELCFADTYLAMLCRKNNIAWTRYDISKRFVDNAKRKNYSAFQADLHNIKFKSHYDVTIISRSLYQFKSDLHDFIYTVLEASDSIIICETIKSFSNSKVSFFRWLAKKLTHSGDLEHVFRYNKESIESEIESIQSKFNLKMVKRVSNSNTIFYLLQKDI